MLGQVETAVFNGSLGPGGSPARANLRHLEEEEELAGYLGFSPFVLSYKLRAYSQAPWLLPATPAGGGRKQRDQEFKVIIGFVVSPGYPRYQAPSKMAEGRSSIPGIPIEVAGESLFPSMSLLPPPMHLGMLTPKPVAHTCTQNEQNSIVQTLVA